VYISILPLVTQHAMRMRRVIFAVFGLSGSITFLPHYLIKGTIFGGGGAGGVIEHYVCVLIFYTSSFWKFFILRIIQRDSVVNVHTSSCKVLVFSCYTLMKFEFS
jgi:hypothetical protein